MASRRGRRATSSARTARSSCSTDAGRRWLRWNFFNAWPTKWTGPTFNAEGNDVAIETLELAHEGRGAED